MNGVSSKSGSLLWLPRDAHRALLPATSKHALTARFDDWATDQSDPPGKAIELSVYDIVGDDS